MKTLSTREQLDCLIVALESNLESMDAYEKSCADRAEADRRNTEKDGEEA